MKASIVDLRYKMKDVLLALDRNETVQILFHGKLKGTLIPPKIETKKEIKDHPFFGMNRDDKESVERIMDELRGSRYHAL